MLKRLIVLAALVLLVLLALPALSADQPKRVAADATKAPALTADQAAIHAKLQRLVAPNPTLKLAPGAVTAFNPSTVKKEISCGVLVYPPTTDPLVLSQRLYFVNNTGETLPAGVYVEWQVEGNPRSCCKGVTGVMSATWPANPPSFIYFTSFGHELMPPQPWTRPCKAWAIIPQ